METENSSQNWHDIAADCTIYIEKKAKVTEVREKKGKVQIKTVNQTDDKSRTYRRFIMQAFSKIPNLNIGDNEKLNPIATITLNQEEMAVIEMIKAQL